MPCYKCSNGKWKYGEKGRCQFDTLESCEAAERAIHARQNKTIVEKSEYFSESCDDCKNSVDNHYHKPYND